MAVTTNSNSTYAGVNAGQVAFVDVRGTWSGAAAWVQTKSNGTYTNYASDAVQTADFARYYQVGDEDGVNIRFVNANANATSLEVSVTSHHP